MGKPKPAPPPPQAYRDDLDADAVSMHTTPDDYDYDDGPELPSYSDSEAAAAAAPSSSTTADTQPRTAVAQEEPFTSDPYATLRSEVLHTSGGKVRNVNETGIRMQAELASDPDALLAYLTDYISVVPPRPLVRIVGTHQETRYNASSKKNERERVVDFDVVFNLQRHLSRENGMHRAFVADNSDKTYRGSCLRQRAKGYKADIEVGETANPSLQDWCRDYCASRSWLRIFRVRRELVGFDEQPIRSLVESAVRSTHYHGHLDISFPVEEKNVDVYSPHWINRARISWIRYLFYFTLLFLLTWPALLLMTKWWSVYTVSWSWSRRERVEGSEDAGSHTYRQRRVLASISEQAWAERHKNLIKTLVLEKFQGDASGFATDVPDERVEGLMRGRGTGNADVDAAVSFVRGGVGLWNAAHGRGGGLGGDPRAWGADS